MPSISCLTIVFTLKYKCIQYHKCIFSPIFQEYLCSMSVPVIHVLLKRGSDKFSSPVGFCVKNFLFKKSHFSTKFLCNSVVVC